MARYLRVFSLEENLYQTNSPILLCAGALLNDSKVMANLVQLKFKNLSLKKINKVKVSITALGKSGEVLCDSFSFVYDGLEAERGSEFGSNIPIYLDENGIDSFKVRISEVVFCDDTSWAETKEEWVQLPPQELLKDTLESEPILESFQKKYGEEKIYMPYKKENIWRCSCGEVNLLEENCSKCQANYEELLKGISNIQDEIIGNQVAKMNDILKEFQCSMRLSDDYKTEDLENLIGNIAMSYKKQDKRGRNPLLSSDQFNSCFIELLKIADENYFADSNAWKCASYQIRGAVFLRYYFREVNRFFPLHDEKSKELFEKIGTSLYYSLTYKEHVWKEASTFNIGLRHNVLYALDDETSKIIIDSFIPNRDAWRNTSMVTLSPVMKVVKEHLQLTTPARQQYVSGVDYKIQDVVQRMHTFEQVQVLLKNPAIGEAAKLVGVSGIHHVPCSSVGGYVIVLKNNFYAVMHYCPESAVNKFIILGDVVYGARLPYEFARLSSDTQEMQIDLSGPLPTEKDTSVFGCALVGASLGGTVGSIIGASYAVEKNARKALLQENYTPVQIDFKEKKISVDFEDTFPSNNRNFIYISPTILKKGSKAVDTFIEKFREAASLENVYMGELIKEYVSQASSKQFNEKDFQNYLMKKKRDERDAYWAEHSDLKQEKEERLSLLKREMSSFKQEKDSLDAELSSIAAWYETEDEKILSMLIPINNSIDEKKKELNNLGLLSSLFAKKNLQNEIDELEAKRKQIMVEVGKKKSVLSLEYADKCRPIQNKLNHLQSQLDPLSREYDAIKDELTWGMEIETVPTEDYIEKTTEDVTETFSTESYAEETIEDIAESFTQAKLACFADDEFMMKYLEGESILTEEEAATLKYEWLKSGRITNEQFLKLTRDEIEEVFVEIFTSAQKARTCTVK